MKIKESVNLLSLEGNVTKSNVHQWFHKLDFAIKKHLHFCLSRHSNRISSQDAPHPITTLQDHMHSSVSIMNIEYDVLFNPATT